MKKTIVSAFLMGIVLAWCQTQNTEIKTNSLEPVNPVATINCSAPNYYENIKLEKQVSFAWDGEQEAYIAEVPELCVKFISRPYNTISDEKWKDWTKKEAEAWLLIKNNGFETKNSNGDRRLNHFLIRNKLASASLDEAIQDHYVIRSKNNPYERNGKNYCEIIKDERVDTETVGNKIQQASATNSLTSYKLLTLSDVLTPEEKQEEYYISSQFCGSNYPFVRDNFDTAHNNQLLYSEDHPERYILYRVDDSQDRPASLFANLEVQFTD